MKKLLVSMIALSVFCGAANAQLPGKLRKRAEEALKGNVGTSEQEASPAAAGEPARSRPPARQDPDRKYPPGVSYSSLLNGVNLLAKNGQFRLHHIQTTFVPDDCEGGFVVLRTADGTELFQFDWRPDRLKKPYTLLNIHKTTDLKSGEQKAGGVDLSTPGDYVLDFYLPTEHFYTFPFSVAKAGSDDPFGGGDAYVLEGDWARWGYLYYADAQPDRSLVWKLWLRSKTAREQDAKISVEIKRDADDQLVCTSRGSVNYTLRPEWTRYEFDMIFPQELTSGGQYFKAKDLLATDGAYTLTTKVNDEVYGVWKFGIENSQLKYQGRTVRGAAGPLTFIEGGKDAWWYAKEGS